MRVTPLGAASELRRREGTSPKHERPRRQKGRPLGGTPLHLASGAQGRCTRLRETRPSPSHTSRAMPHPLQRHRTDQERRRGSQKCTAAKYTSGVDVDFLQIRVKVPPPAPRGNLSDKELFLLATVILKPPVSPLSLS